MFGTSKTKTTVKNGFVVPKESNWARLTEAQLFIYPTGIYVVETISNERYEVVPGNGPRYAIKNDTTKGYSEFISIE